ncbi:MAG: hypothetical protein JXO22_06380 [Phycisphaerae bacterium]|nr:hypothetical protein [Phycisphaerae bacterium]
MPIRAKTIAVCWLTVLGMLIGGCVIPSDTTGDATDPNDTQVVEQDPPGINIDLTGRWDMFEVVETNSENIWDGSVLRIESQTLNGNVFDIEGRINWRLEGETAVIESFRGTFDPETLALQFEGYEFDPTNYQGFGVYTATVNHQGNLIYDGTWDIELTDNHGTWIAQPIEDE